MSDNPGIQAMMRLNARLHKRIDVLATALEFVSGPKDSPCGGAIVTDEDGKPFNPDMFSPDMLATMRSLHAKSCMRCFARRVLDDCNDLSAADPADRYHVITEVLARCDAQDQQWGGPEHDDTHTPREWVQFICDFAQRAGQHAYGAKPAVTADTCPPDRSGYEDALIDVAALAISAILSSRRKSGQTDSVKQPFSPQTFSGKDESA